MMNVKNPATQPQFATLYGVLVSLKPYYQNNMKKLFSLICLLSFTWSVNAQAVDTKVSKKNKSTALKYPAANNSASAGNENLAFEETQFDFGKIPQGKPVTHIFEFTNTGTQPLALENVQASCGCTTPVWNKDTVYAGQSSQIKVGYNAANTGPFDKSITIYWNGGLSKQITIKGEVWETPLTSAPLNNSLITLKNEQ